MNRFLLSVFLAFVGVVLVLPDAEARRFGGGRSLGMQRNVAPAPARAAPQQATQAPQKAGAQQAAPAGSRWMPILGGLALGGLLGALFAGNGLGGLLLVALLVFGAVIAFRAFARQRAAGQAHAVQYAGAAHEDLRLAEPLQAGAPAAAPQARASVAPPGFNEAAFLRGAKMNFTRLQLANDAGDLEQIRDVTTAELFDELVRDLRARGGEPQQTDVTDLEAELLEVATEGDAHVASVRFTGRVCEGKGAPPEPFAEVWNLTKPVDGSSGWLLAGIQQMH